MCDGCIKRHRNTAEGGLIPLLVVTKVILVKCNALEQPGGVRLQSSDYYCFATLNETITERLALSIYAHCESGTLEQHGAILLPPYRHAIAPHSMTVTRENTRQHLEIL